MKIPVYFKETSSRVFFILQLDSRELAVNRGLVEEIVGTRFAIQICNRRQIKFQILVF